MDNAEDTRPQTVQIGPICYRIEYVHGLHDEEGNLCNGRIHVWEALIEIEARLDPQEQRVTLWHEVLHALLRQAGYTSKDVSENALESLGYGVLGILMNNPFMRS